MTLRNARWNDKDSILMMASEGGYSQEEKQVSNLCFLCLLEKPREQIVCIREETLESVSGK